ncbi:MAG TPA: DNA polymerase Y family protein [Actinocrinis sp.]|uniref:DNA polymerase Y family protein n=1 Tax=Actinocrinis sp. TaxID=1920516 RepID=UPI002DDCE588|nr:DNA polymerase Y family protein [Actinocrinis sp.]HEV2345569.1 DNA polymerase Y family protein [Actinocrinis sp.]
METRPLRTLALCCPDWPVVAAGAAAQAPVAILEGEGARRIVTTCSYAARESGVRPGQRIREARRRCPQLVVYRRDEARDAREFETVVAAAEDLAASVEVVRPGLITLDVRGPARYHGGEVRLAALIRDVVATLATASGDPIGCGVGIADGPFAAALAARTSGIARDAVIVESGATADFLAPYPVTVLDRPDLAKSLTRLGVRTLGSFAALPGANVAGRLGVEGMMAHRLARGLDPRPSAARRSADRMSVVHEFDPPADQDELVAFVGAALANRLHLALAVAAVACARLGIDIVTASGRGCYRLWRHGGMLGGRLSAPAVAERIRWQLDGWRAREPYPTADPVVTLRLIPDRLLVDRGGWQASRDFWDPQDSWDSQSQDAWSGGANVPGRVERAIERVETMLGPGVVQRPRFNPRFGGGHVSTSQAPLPHPPLLPTAPCPAELRDAAGGPIAVTERARLTGEPALLTVFGKVLSVTGWAGPWETRLQCATADGRAWLLTAQGESWQVEGVYG